MKAALYVRVSTERQAEEGFSLDAQKDLLIDYCKKNNIEVFDIYSDDGISGQKENRPQFQRMLSDAEKKSFNIILVHKFDRFARKVELSQRIKIQLKKSSVNVISITEPIEDSPMGFFVSGLHELLAEYYIKNLSQEVKKGLNKRASLGLHNGSVPYGYKLVNSNMVINEEQAIIVKKIFEMYNAGYGSIPITRWLNESGISSAIPGCHWEHHAILYILRNVKYIGYIKQAGEIYQGIHSPIISREAFDLAQRYLKDRYISRSPKGKNHIKRMLLGLLRCGVCGKQMSIVVSLRKTKAKERVYYSYYACSDSSHRDNVTRCKHRKRYPVDAVESEVIEYLETLLKIQAPLEMSHIDNDLIKTSQLKKLEEELNRAEAAYLASVDDLVTYAKNKKGINEKILSLKSKVIEKTDIKKQLSNALEEFEQSTPSNKRLILSRFINSIEISPGKELSKLKINFM